MTLKMRSKDFSGNSRNMYAKARTFWLPPKAPGSSLLIYKSNYFKSCTLKLQIWKKTYFAVLQVFGRCNLKSKNFVSLTVQTYHFLITCFKTIVLKTCFTENKGEVKVFEVPVFVTLLIEPLSFCVSDYDRKIKENSHSV